MSVLEALMAAEGVNKAPVAVLDIFVRRGFLSRSECSHLIRLINARRKPSSLFSKHPDPEFRTSETCNLEPGDAVVRTVDARLSDLLGIERKYGEYLQGQRYGKGQQYKPHHDYLDVNQPYWQSQRDVGGQRTWTAMVFLNVPEKGGETYFPTARLAIPPRTGSVVIWNNLNPDGTPNRASLHQGLPVILGEKFIITKWYREDPWGPQAQAL
jgi:prolyl 4-hydroxylase